MTTHPFTLLHPGANNLLPLVCDSPHSGTHYPDDFRPCAPMPVLRQGEDTHIERLWSAVPEFGGTLLSANFPRTYIDPNRSLDDLDADLLDGPWPQALAPGEKTRLGYGLVWRQVNAETPIYDRRLTVAEVQQRIDRYWRPYREALNREVDGAHRRFGGVWHLNLHSMPNNAYQRLGIRSTRPLADFVLGDRDGTTCEPGLMDVVQRSLQDAGYSVARNDPYKGVAVLAEIGRPQENRHSLQIEIRRPLYMDEASRQPNTGFAPLQSSLRGVLRDVAAYVRSRMH